MMRRAGITGIGSSIPERVVTNLDLEKFVDTSDEWIKTRTGISERRYSEKGEGLSIYAINAAKKAIDMAGISAKDLDLIMCATVTPDQPLPATACFIHQALEAENAAAFDLAAACSGFLYGLTIADQFIKTGKYRNILVVGGEMLSKFIDFKDRTTCVLFGDGAGAAVVSAIEEKDYGILATSIHNDGSMSDFLSIPAGGSRMPASVETVNNRDHFVKMKGNETFKLAIRCMHKVSLEVLEEAGMTPEDIDLFIPHQANKRITDSVAQRLKAPPERVYENIDRIGNTSAGSIPIALSEVYDKGLIKKGDVLLMTAFGGGLTWGSVLVKWNLG